MKKVLVTAIGTITATSIVQELRNSDEIYYIIGTDTNDANQIVTSKDVDEFYKFPSSVDYPDEYLEFVLSFCESRQIEYVFSVIDEEVLNYSRNRARFEKIGVKLCIANEQLINICHYKDQFNKWLWLNMPEFAIKTYNVKDEELKYPVFIKPIEGRASNGCEIINSWEELRQHSNLDDYVVQEFVEGKVITADVIQNLKYHQFLCVSRVELLRNKNGCGVAVRTIKNDLIEDICRKIALQLKLNGVINIEFFVDNDLIKIIEINPRFSAGSFFSYMAGCNLAKEAINIADEVRCEFGHIVIGKNYARRYEAYEL